MLGWKLASSYFHRIFSQLFVSTPSLTNRKKGLFLKTGLCKQARQKFNKVLWGYHGKGNLHIIFLSQGDQLCKRLPTNQGNKVLVH